ncbi:hypothetical protein OIDMADRAFT_62094 [Oidiodendron maius Zn]|uniref:Glycosyl hydrolase family 32 N-terminal domain-containing protein n=1 Tax=Oidiodendron maius (strain Zn) TaxID=913774 RepID=A0A0C3G9U5_OIDMZ|nr:hypothetical protein OIDMADRAFT_62094 [Oidiodendron maius Zn]
MAISLSLLLGQHISTEYMMVSSSVPGRSQLHLYKSNDLLDWKFVATILDVEAGSRISPTSSLRFGMNFECAGLFSSGQRDYIVVGVEEDVSSKCHRQHYTLWLGGTLILEGGSPRFEIFNYGLLDHGILYAPHLLRDSNDRLIQLGLGQ